MTRDVLRYSDWILQSDYLPRMTATAIRMSADSGTCFSRQPSLARAIAVVDRVREHLEDRGLRAHIRIDRNTRTVGVYLVPAMTYSDTGGAA